MTVKLASHWVACPQCKAKIGEPCTGNASGLSRPIKPTESHLARYNALANSTPPQDPPSKPETDGLS